MDPTRCPFCRIASDRSGSGRAEIIHEDRDTIAFLPLRLQAYGHTIVAPRAHIETIWELDAERLGLLLQAARMLAERYRTTIGATGVNLLHASGRDAQQSVPHVHLHLLPRFPQDGIDAWPRLAAVEVDRADLGRRLRGGS